MLPTSVGTALLPASAMYTLEKWSGRMLTREDLLPKIKEGLWHQSLGATSKSCGPWRDGAKVVLRPLNLFTCWVRISKVFELAF